MTDFRAVEEVDYDPFEGEEPTTEKPAPQVAASTGPQPAEPPADYVIPSRSSYKIPKIVRADDLKKPEPKGPAFTAGEEVDFDPFEEGSFAPEAGKALAGGAVSTTAGMAKGAGAYRQQEMLARKQEAARAKWLADNGYTGVTVIDDLPPAKQAEFKKAMADVTAGAGTLDFTQDPFYKAGLATENWGAEQFKAAHDYEDSWTRKIGEGFGSILPYLAVGAATGPAGAGAGIVAGGTAGMFGSIGEAVDTAVQKGATPEQLQQVITYAGIPGVTDQLSVEALLGKVPLPVAGKLVSVLGQIAAKALVEGGQEAAQQAMQNVIAKYVYKPDQDLMEGVAESAGIGAIVGGGVGVVTPETYRGEKDDTEKPAKADDQSEVAAPVLPEGTPATPDAAVGAPTPGDLSAKPAVPPAGADKQPNPAQPVAAPPTATDTRTLAKPPLPVPATPAVAKQPVVTETRKGDVDPAAKVALGGTAGAGPANIQGGTPPVAVLPEEEADIEEEPVADIEAIDEDASAAAARERWAPIVAREKAAEQVIVPPVAANDADIKAALATPGKKVTIEPAVPTIAPTPVAPTTATPMQETLGTGRALQEPAPVPAATMAAAPASPITEAGAPLSAPTEEAPAPALLPTEPAPIEAAPLPAARAAETAQPIFTAEQEVDFDPFAGEPPVSSEPAVSTAPGAAAEPTPAGKAPKAVKATGKAAERAPVVEAPTPPPTSPSKPVAAPRAEALKKKAVPKGAGAKKVPPPVAGTTTKISREEALAPREHERAPAEPTARAKRTPMERDISDMARTDLKERTSQVSDLGDFNTAVDEATDEILADNPRPASMSPAAYMRETSAKIADRVEEKLSPQLASLEKQRERLEEARTPEGRAKQAEEERVARMAAATKPQQKERAKKGGEKSAAGIRAESEQSTSDAVKRNEAKPEVERDPHLTRWNELRKERTKAKGVEAKAEITKQMQAVQEERAAAAEKQTEGEVLTPRAVAADKAVREVLTPSPRLMSSAHVRGLWESFKGLKLSKKLDTKKQTPAENFAIWIRGIVAQAGGKRISDEDQLEAYIAHKLLEAGNNQGLYETITSDTIEGLGTDGDAADKIAQMAAEDEDEQELRRGGAAGARARGVAGAARAAKGAKGPRALTITKPDGTDVPIRVMSTRKGSAVLAEINSMAEPTEGFIGMLQNMLTKKLSGLVGDVDVHIVSPETMAKLGKPGVSGLYYDYNDAMRAAGYRPMVFINAMEQLDPALYSHTGLHELTHAATSQAIRDNAPLADVLTKMRQDLFSQLRTKYSEQELADAGLRHAFRSNAEFIAEAFTNKEFQSILAQVQVPTQLRASVHRLTPNRAPTWWDAFTGAVSRAIGMIRGVRGQTYIEQVIKLDPVLFRSEIAQAKRAREKMVSPAKADAFVPGSIDALDRGIIDQAKRHVLPRFRFGAGDVHLRDLWSTTGGIMRDSQTTWGNDLLYDLGREALRKDEIFKERRRSPGEGIDAQKMEEDYAVFESKHQKEAENLDSVLNNATIFEVDPTVGLDHPNNSHISKKGARSSQQRDQHAKLQNGWNEIVDGKTVHHPGWNELSPTAQAMGKRLIEHYRKTHDLEMNAIVREAFLNSQDRFGGSLPPGKTIEDAVQWVRDGGAARKEDERTADDKEWHKALGKTAESMADVKELTKKKGIYVPLHREGKFFIAGEEQVYDPNNLPQGASVEPIRKGSKQHFGNQLVFTNAKDAAAFRATKQGYTRLTFRHIDPATGKRVSAVFSVADPNAPGGLRTAKKEYIVTVQNKLMEMSNNEGELQQRRDDLIKDGMRVSDVRLSGADSRSVAEQISEPQIKRLLKNVGQTTIGQTPVGQQALHDAILDAHIRQLTSPGHLQRRLKRKNVKGEVSSTFKALQAYNRSIGNHLANLEVQQAVSKAHTKAQQFIDQDSYNRFGKDSRVSQDRQSQLNEVVDRIRNVKNETTDAGYARILNHVRNYAVLRYLASPHYVIMQGIQFYTGSIPVLAKHGLSGYRATRELHRALKLGGGWRGTGKRGLQEFGKAVKGKKAGDINQMWQDAVAGEPDGAELQKVLAEISALGFGASNSIEAPSVAEADMTKPQKLMHRGVNVAMAMPQAIEASNRNAMAIASYRLAKQQGLSNDAALKRAVLSVEEAQGGYGAGNFNSVMRNPLLAAAFQFRKYGISYAGVYYRALTRSLAGATPAEKKAARRQLGYMTVMAGLFAGVFGQAGMEVVRTLVNLVALSGAIDDWEEDENEIQEWLSGMIAWASGSEALGDKLSEAALRGPTRLLGLDTASSLSQDNVVTFGQPKTMDEEGTGWWLAKMFIGASGGMAVDTMKSFAKSDFSTPLKAGESVVDMVPLPKMLDSVFEATKKMVKGITNPETGEQWAEPSGIGEALIQTTGFRAAEASRPFEAGGEVATKKAMRAERHERTTLMSKWRARSGADQREFFESEIRAWNRAHPNRDDRIDFSDLRRSVRSSKQRQEELEREMAQQ